MDKRKEGLRNKRVCRFCLKDDEPLTSIFDRTIRTKNSVPLALQIMACVSIEVFPSDGMPGTICQVCRYFMDQSYRFKQICRQGDEALRHYVTHGELRSPIPWPQDMIKTVPSEILSNTTVQVATEEELTEEEEEVDVPFDMAEIEKIHSSSKKKKQMKKSPRRSEKILPQSIKQNNTVENVEVVESSSYILDDTENDPGMVFEAKPDENKAFPCTLCHHSFPLKQLLDLHMVNHQRKRTHACPLCSKSFFNKYDLQHHIMIHSGSKPYQCVICEKKFTRLSMLRRHEKVHRTAAQYLCSQCNGAFLSANLLQEHIARKHVTDRPHKCEVCSKCFAFKQGLDRHVLTHESVLPHKCNYCSQSFTHANTLQRHVLQKHAGDRPYLCKFCPKSFLLSHHYTRHLKSKHDGKMAINPMRRRVQTDIAADVTNEQQQGSPQIKNRIKAEMEQFKCVQCDTMFDKQDDLIFHSAVHATQDLTCPLCKESFEDVDEVVVHIKSHIEGEQYMCEWCELVFTSEEKLDEHIDTHHREAATQDLASISYLEGQVIYKTEMGEDGTVTLQRVQGEQIGDDMAEEGAEGEGEEYAEDEEEDEEEGMVVDEHNQPSSQSQAVSEDAGNEEEDEGGLVIETPEVGEESVMPHQHHDPASNPVVMESLPAEWTPVLSSSGSAQKSELQELMVVGGGETIVYQLSAQQQTPLSDIPQQQQATNIFPGGVSIELQLPDASAQATNSPKTLTPVHAESPHPVYAELKTVDHSLYASSGTGVDIGDKMLATLKTSSKKDTPTKKQTEKVKETKGLSSILQKAEEVKQQKKRLEELKMKARMEMLKNANNSTKKTKEKIVEEEKKRGEDEDSDAWDEAPDKRTTQKKVSDAVSDKKKDVGVQEKKKQKILERAAEVQEKVEKRGEKRYLQKMLSFSKQTSSEDKSSKEMTQEPPAKKATTVESPTNKKASESKQQSQQKVEPPKPETPVRAGEKSLMMLERDIMELKKNAGQKSSTQISSSPSSSSRFMNMRMSRANLNSSTNDSNKTWSQLKKSSTHKDSEKTTDTAKSQAVKFPIPIIPLQEATTPTKDSKSPQKKETPPRLHKYEQKKQPPSANPAVDSLKPTVSPSNESSPRRSRRASKIKDYAAMIRDNTNVGSDDDEDEHRDAGEDGSQTDDTRPLDDDSDDDVDVNEEVLIHRATPAKTIKVPGRGRGRPRKYRVELQESGESKSPSTTPQKRSKPSEEPQKKKEEVDEAIETPAKRRRGRPCKLKPDEVTMKTPAANNVTKKVAGSPVATTSSNKVSVGGGDNNQPGRMVIQRLEAVSQDGKPQTLIMSPGGQPLKKIPAQLIKSLPPGVKPLPLPSSMSTLGSPVGQVSQMKIGPKTVRVQKILMTKSQLQAMTEKGLVQMKDGAMVLKQGVKLPSNEVLNSSPKTQTTDPSSSSTTTPQISSSEVKDITSTLETASETAIGAPNTKISETLETSESTS